MNKENISTVTPLTRLRSKDVEVPDKFRGALKLKDRMTKANIKMNKKTTNGREAERHAYENLQRILPIVSQYKRCSHVELLKSATDYIKSLKFMLQNLDECTDYTDISAYTLDRLDPSGTSVQWKHFLRFPILLG